jgi:hypothetical protein
LQGEEEGEEKRERVEGGEERSLVGNGTMTYLERTMSFNLKRRKCKKKSTRANSVNSFSKVLTE